MEAYTIKAHDAQKTIVVSGCIHTNVSDGTVCDDGSACTAGDACTAGVCAGGTLCDDDNQCTDNVCDPATGCSAEVLDHIVSNRAASGWVREAAYSRGNADAPRDLETTATTALRSSDHDGMVVYLGPRTRSGSVGRRMPETRRQKRSPMAR